MYTQCFPVACSWYISIVIISVCTSQTIETAVESIEIRIEQRQTPSILRSISTQLHTLYEACGRCWMRSVLLFAWTRENMKCIYFGRNVALLSTKSTMCCCCCCTEWDTHSVQWHRYTLVWGWVSSIMTFQVESPANHQQPNLPISKYEIHQNVFDMARPLCSLDPGIAVNSWNLWVLIISQQLSELLQMKWRYFNLLKRTISQLSAKITRT